MKNLKDSLATIQIAQGRGISTGFPALDEAINGLQRKEVVLLAGRTSMGKTALALDMALATSQVANTAFFSLEMSADSLITRAICNKQQVSFQSLVRGEVTPNADTIRFLENSRLWIDDRSGLTSQDILNAISTASPPLDVVFIDYLQLVRPPSEKRARYEEIDKIAEHLRNIAKHYNLAMVISSQLNREVDKREKHEPRLADLRESGGIEQVCDKILLIYRPSYYPVYDLNQKAEDDSEGWIIVAKQRNGMVGRVPVVWMGEYMSYRPVNFKLEESF